MSGLPRKPVGKNIKTTIKTLKAATSLYSIETYPDHIVSISPISNPPNIAPGKDPIPPSTAAVNALGIPTVFFLGAILAMQFKSY